MLCDTDGSDTGASTTVRNTEGLVQVEMADISTDLTRRAKANLCVHVGTIHVNLATVLVNDSASLLDLRLEDTECARVSDHEGTEFLTVLLALGLEVGHIKVTSGGIALDGNDTHTGHRSTCRVGTVSRDGNQADITLLSRLLLEVLADDTEACKFTLGTRVGLKRNGMEASDL